MKNLFNLKWLMATVLLCTPMFVCGAEDNSSLLTPDLDWGSVSGSGWNCTYNTTTHIATYSSSYGGASRWLNGTDCSDYEGIKVIFKTENTYSYSLTVNYASDGQSSTSENVTGSGSNEEQELYVALNSSYSNSVNQVYVCIGQISTDDATIELVSITLIAKTGDNTESKIITSDGTDYLNLAWSATYGWDESNSINTTDGISGTITINEAWGGFRWDYTDGLNLSDYSQLIVHYSGATTPYLYIEDSSEQQINSDGISGSDGAITCTFSDYANVNFYSIKYVTLKSATSGTISITSIELVEGKKTSPYVSVTEDGAYLNFTTEYETWAANDAMVSNTGSVPNSATITITEENWSNGAGCKYSSNGSLDITDYYQMVVNYTVTATDEDNQAGINVKLNMYSGSEGYAGLYDSQNTGTMRFTIANSVEGFDPTDINKIIFQANYPCTITVSSIEFLTEEQAATSDENMLYSKFYLWDDAIKNGCTKSSDTYVEGSDENDHAPFKINNAHSWDGGNWWFGDVDEDQYWGIEIKVQTTQSVKVRIAIQYYMESTYSDFTEKYTAYCTANEETTLILPFLSSYDHYVDEVFIQVGELEDDDTTCDITVTSAKLVGSKNETYQGDYVTILTSDTDGWATYYLGTADYRMPLGLEGTTVTGTGEVVSEEDAENIEFELTTPWEYKNEENNVNGGDIVPAGTPLVLKGVGDEPYVTYTAFLDTTGNGEEPETNWLHGKDEPATAEEMVTTTSEDNDDNGEVDYYYFKLSYNTAGEVGFFAGASDCAAFTMQNTHKAWLAIEQSVIDNIGNDGQEGKFAGFCLSDTDNSGNIAGEESTTGITAAPVIGESEAIYNLQGVRVNEMNQKGIYIVGGKKIVKQ